MPRPLIASASQVDDVRACERLWWFKRVARLPERRRGSRAFGDVLHAVLERWLLADDLGRDRDGRPVDLYPPGWRTTKSRFGAGEGQTVSEAEGALIQRLVQAAIEQEVVQRSPGRRVEHRFRRRVLEFEPCVACNGAGVYGEIPCGTCGGSRGLPAVEFTGFMDVAFKDEVRDHKTSKSTRYLKSPKALAEDLQMLAYARELIEEARDRGEPLPAELTLRHNQFVKDPARPLVRTREAVVARAAVEGAWKEKIVPALRRMRELKQLRADDAWAYLPMADSNTCSYRYGGCSYLRVCAKACTPDEHRAAVEEHERRLARRAAKTHKETTGRRTQQTPRGVARRQLRMLGSQDEHSRRPTGRQEERLVVNFVDKLKARKAQQAALAKGAPREPERPRANVNPPATAASKPEPEREDPDAPPWASRSCTACRGKGFNTKGSPCRICDVIQSKKGGPRISSYLLEVVDGVVLWSRDGEVLGGVALSGDVEAAPAKRVEPERAPAEIEKAPERAAETPPTQAPAAAARPTKPAPAKAGALRPPERAAVAAAAVSGPPPRRTGRPRKSFTLLVNCAPVKGFNGKRGTGSGIHRLDEAIARFGAALAAQNGVESYYQLDGFRRRDLLCASAPIMATEFGSDVVVACTSDVEQRELIRVLAPLAGNVVEAVSR